MAIPNRRGPRALSDILGDLFTTRGYGRFLAQRELENAWNEAVGEPSCRQTRLGEIRRGVLSVIVAHPALLEELSAFRKPELLAALRSAVPSASIHDLRFRVGPIETAPDQDDPNPASAPAVARDRPSSRAGRRGSRPGRAPQDDGTL